MQSIATFLWTSQSLPIVKRKRKTCVFWSNQICTTVIVIRNNQDMFPVGHLHQLHLSESRYEILQFSSFIPSLDSQYLPILTEEWGFLKLVRQIQRYQAIFFYYSIHDLTPLIIMYQLLNSLAKLLSDFLVLTITYWFQIWIKGCTE